MSVSQGTPVINGPQSPLIPETLENWASPPESVYELLMIGGAGFISGQRAEGGEPLPFQATHKHTGCLIFRPNKRASTGA